MVGLHVVNMYHPPRSCSFSSISSSRGLSILSSSSPCSPYLFHPAMAHVCLLAPLKASALLKASQRGPSTQILAAVEDGPSANIFQPMMVTTRSVSALLTHVTLGTGCRNMADRWGPEAQEGTNTAISWACINASLLRGLGGLRRGKSLFLAKEDLSVFTTGTEAGRMGIPWVPV